MKRLPSAGAAGITRGLLLSLAAVSLAASAVTPKTVSAPSGGPPIAALSVVAQEPVSRLIIRYRSGVKTASQGGATPATERAEAAMQVARTAHVAEATGLRYLKSVSASLHVAALEEPLSPEQAQALMQRLRADPAVEDVVIDRRVKPHFTPSDPLFTGGDQWHLQASSVVPGGINAAAAWDSSIGAGVVMAMLDGGYRPHVDLAANVLAGYDFVSADSSSVYGGDLYWTANDGNARDADATDPGDWITDADAAAGYCDAAASSTWHGTHVAGLAGAVGNNGEGGLGVAFGAKILPVRVLGRCGGYLSDIQAGARWAAGLSVIGIPVNTNPAKVLNLSLGLPGACDSITQSVIDEVLARNVAIVASAGNDYATIISVPANCNGVIAVTAHTREGDSADYANVGTGVAISAPGGGNNTILPPQPGIPREIVSTGNAGTTVPTTDNYLLLRGTSMAAPQVAGVLALLAQVRPTFAMATLDSLMRGAARAFPAGSYCAVSPGYCGSGLLDAQAAVTAVVAAPADSADLAVSQRTSVNELVSGQTVIFTIKATNWGPLASSDVLLRQSVAAGLQIQSVTTDSAAVVSHDASGLSAALTNLPAGEALTLNVTALVTASSGNVTSSVEVSSSSVDPTALNNSDILVSPLVLPEPAPADGGGGCTVASTGQTDAGMLLLLLAALLVLGLRRRQSR